MAIRDALTRRFREALQAGDPVARAVAAHQLAELTGVLAPALDSEGGKPSRWVHVPLADLFASAGNALHARDARRIETGHEPAHGSRSGRCVTIDAERGRWWCASCRQGGDAASYVMSVYDWPYRRAARWLESRYGPPAGQRRRVWSTPL